MSSHVELMFANQPFNCRKPEATHRCGGSRQPALSPLIASSRSLRSLVLFSLFPSSMETPPIPSPIAAADSAAFGEDSAATEFGFRRAEFGRDPLVGTVQSYDRHVFLRYKTPEIWLPNVESADSGSLPRLLAAAIKARKNDMRKKTRLTICGAEDNADTSDGDVLIFPDRIGYRSLKEDDIDNFVELVLVKDTEWPLGRSEALTGSYIFVCAHGSRDRRCGICGPPLIEKFKEEISLRGLEGQVFVSPCSHIGGHKYAGNIIIFSQNKNGDVFGHWYGYVSPDDVSILLEQHIGKGEIVDHLWRGQMGFSEEEQRKSQSIRLRTNIGMRENGANETIQGSESDPASENMKTTGCCQGNGNFSCCQNTTTAEKADANHTSNSTETRTSSNSSKSSVIFKKFTIPTWLKGPEHDTYATLAVVTAIASVAGAYFCYRQMR